MDITLTNLQKTYRIPQSFIRSWVLLLQKELLRKKIKPHFHKALQKDLSLVFVDKKTIQKLNKDYRSKNKPTDILSFSDIFEDQLGELVLCPEIIVCQAVENNWSQKNEYAYMLLHGLLHLLGYDHEKKNEAQEMFSLQDDIFERLKP